MSTLGNSPDLGSSPRMQGKAVNTVGKDRPQGIIPMQGIIHRQRYLHILPQSPPAQRGKIIILSISQLLAKA